MEHPRTGVTTGLKDNDEPSERRDDSGVAPRGVAELEMGTVDDGVEEDGFAWVDEGVAGEAGAAEDEEVVALWG